jgi:hypothetical protein
MRIRANDKVIYTGEPAGFNSSTGGHRTVWPGYRGKVLAVDRNVAKVEFVVDQEPADFMVSVFDLEIEVFTTSPLPAAKPSFWKTLLWRLNG